MHWGTVIGSKSSTENRFVTRLREAQTWRGSEMPKSWRCQTATDSETQSG